MDETSIANRSEVVQTRRGYALLGLGLLLPGAAQVLHGRPRLGRRAIQLWMVLVLAAVLLLIVTVVFRDFMVGVLATGWVVRALSVVMFAVGGFWVLLTLDTWWLARPARMGTRKSVVYSVVALMLAVVLAGGTVLVGRAVWAAGGTLGEVFRGGGTTTSHAGRYNIVLLGSDAGDDREGVRPDSVTVVSVAQDTGRAVLFSLPRNLENVPFPESSPLRALYPEGYGCESEECLLNAVYKLGLDNKGLYPGVDDPGVQAMVEAAGGITGLEINYYVMINMQGFIDLIDALGGLTININQPVVLNSEDNVVLEAGPNRHLNGYETLWFARSRAEASDYVRMLRQKCVMAAMLKQMNPATVATKFENLAGATAKAAQTSVPPTEITVLAALAQKTRTLPIASVSFTPPMINPADPDYGLIRQTVADTIASSQAMDAAAAQTATPTPGPDETGGVPTPDTPTPDAPSEAPGYDQASQTNITDDLGEVCSVT